VGHAGLDLGQAVDAPEGGERLGDIVRDANGGVLSMDQYAAERYCRQRGTRLPRARELAMYAQSRGACRVLSPEEYANLKETGDCLKSKYHLVSVARSGLQPSDEFYYNNNGYQRPEGDLDRYFFWSSSVASDPSLSDSSYFAYVLVGYTGYIYDSFRRTNEEHAVRCVKSR
jgi:hypothetical protein